MRAAIYARVSLLTQGKADRYSLLEQLEKGREFAKQQGMEVVFETGEKHSGATLHRPKLEEVFERALAGGFDAIIVHEQNRLSREPKGTAYLEVLARLHGIHLFCLDALPTK
jgi:DNA invertase Pin-like site-specific DNA recombinase